MHNIIVLVAGPESEKRNTLCKKGESTIQRYDRFAGR